MKNMLIVAVGAVGGSFAIRIVQVAATVPREPWWWILEAGRWGLIFGAFIALALAVYRLQARVLENERKLAQITTEVMWARLELDVVDPEEYAHQV